VEPAPPNEAPPQELPEESKSPVAAKPVAPPRLLAKVEGEIDWDKLDKTKVVKQ